MPEPIRVEVTPEDIAAGRRHHACGCPVALALARATGRRWAVALAWATRPHESGRGTVIARLPEAVRGAVVFFDATGRMEPFSFEIEEDAG